MVVSGKGGVGKTVVSAALGRALARRGKKVLLVEVDPRESLHQLFGIPPSGGEVVAAGDGLWVQNLKPRAVLDRIVAAELRIGPLVKRVLESPLYAELSAAMPGLKELAVVHHCQVSSGAGRASRKARAEFDLVVLDAPATGHGVTLLTAPRVTARAIGSGPVAAIAGELAGFVESAEETAIATVCRAEEMPVEETFELKATLEERLGRGPDLLVVNALYPPFPADRSLPEPGDPLRLWAERWAINEEQCARLRRDWPGPRVELPLLAQDRGPALVAELARRLEAEAG